jgi:hypothetical protein
MISFRLRCRIVTVNRDSPLPNRPIPLCNIPRALLTIQYRYSPLRENIFCNLFHNGNLIKIKNN